MILRYLNFGGHSLRVGCKHRLRGIRSVTANCTLYSSSMTFLYVNAFTTLCQAG